jgi:hypothetical protein
MRAGSPLLGLVPVVALALPDDATRFWLEHGTVIAVGTR